MRVLYLTGIPAPYRVAYFNELGKTVDLTVCFERPSADYRDKAWQEETSKNYKSIVLKGIKTSSSSALSLEILKIIKSGDFDIIVLHGYSTFTAMMVTTFLKITNQPFILEVDGGIIKKDKKILGYIKRKLISAANAYLCPGEETKKYLLHYGAKKDCIDIYPFTSLYQSEIQNKPVGHVEKKELKASLGIEEENVVISVGRMIHSKGFDLLIEACSQLNPNIGVYIVGGEPTEDYVRLKNKLGVNNVHFVGFKSKKELANYYKSADLFVLMTRYDVWGLVINEAMAYGLPVITTDSCVAGQELIKNTKNGFIINSEDTEELVKRIYEVIYDKRKLEVMGEEAISIIKRYTIEEMAAKHMNFFKDFIDSYNEVKKRDE